MHVAHIGLQINEAFDTARDADIDLYYGKSDERRVELMGERFSF